VFGLAGSAEITTAPSSNRFVFVLRLDELPLCRVTRSDYPNALLPRLTHQYLGSKQSDERINLYLSPPRTIETFIAVGSVLLPVFTNFSVVKSFRQR